MICQDRFTVCQTRPNIGCVVLRFKLTNEREAGTKKIRIVEQVASQRLSPDTDDRMNQDGPSCQDHDGLFGQQLSSSESV